MWERETVQVGEGQRDGEWESHAGLTLSAQSPMQDSNSRNRNIMTWAETKTQTLNWLSHPGALVFLGFFVLFVLFLFFLCLRIFQKFFKKHIFVFKRNLAPKACISIHKISATLEIFRFLEKVASRDSAPLLLSFGSSLGNFFLINQLFDL